MIRRPLFENDGKEDSSEDPQFVSEGTPMLSIKMGLVNSDESKRFSCVADEERVEDGWSRGQFLWRGEEEEGGFRVVSYGVHSRNDLVGNCLFGQFIQMHRLHRSTILYSFIDLGHLICC